MSEEVPNTEQIRNGILFREFRKELWTPAPGNCGAFWSVPGRGAEQIL
ncbi:MAG: hypothetical protein PUC46_08600 [Lachnospiraceae bacterium]|nr:hypothetical protein [Lachnospiraceae bacterium]